MSTYNKQYYDQNKDRIQAANKAWRDRNPDKVQANIKKWQAANREKKRANTIATRRRRNGFVGNLFAQRLSEQKGICPICLTTEKVVAADHCHATNMPRGILCKRCNLLLGHAKDDPALLKRAIEYLELWKRTA